MTGYRRTLCTDVSSMRAVSGFEIASGVTGLDPATATPTTCSASLRCSSFVALYSTTGGLRSVIATDVLQLDLMLVGTAIYAGIAVERAGGLGRHAGASRRNPLRPRIR